MGFYSLQYIATFLELFLESNTCQLKKLAASIQETFDCSVLLINWNTTLIPKKPDLEIIFRYYKKYLKRNNADNLYGWYSNKVEIVKTNIATLICQRTNCNYDFSLRTRYSNSVLILAILTFTILLIICGFFEVTLTSFITSVLFPSLPVFALAFKQITSNKEAIKNLTELQYLIENELGKIKINDSIDDHLIRQIQDKIYLKRINSPLLPEWTYNFLRLRLEEEMHFSVEEKISELNDHSNKQNYAS